MSLTDRVRADRLQARKARDGDRVTALGGLLAALQEAAVQARGDLSEQDEIALLRRERKRREEGAASFREGGREDDARQEEAEAELIGAYLPAEMDAGELAAIVDAAIAEAGATSPRELGAVMKLVMARTEGRADGKAVSALVRGRLGG
ncbi:MAG: uncharacterized protein QOE98_861 [Gaiellaceae bacterium]|nr:uncharacterized protein [Gaiellaceae bacterium]